MGSKHDIADVLVIGAGASGGAFTWSLTQAGVKVVCLEQGGWVPLNAFPVSEPQAQLHWQTDFHPNPNFRGLPEDYPVNEDDTPIAPYMYNAVGGSTIHWGSHFSRFHPSDFRLKSLDGVADDWPMDYFELEPYYDQNDRMHGVSGLRGDPVYPPKPERPTPPLPIGPGGEKLARAFNQLGWHWWSADNAVASTAYDGRQADVGEYLRSPSSSDIIFWPRALKQGARLITHARVREILVDESGRATGAAYYDRNAHCLKSNVTDICSHQASRGTQPRNSKLATVVGKTRRNVSMAPIWASFLPACSVLLIPLMLRPIVIT